MTSKAIVYKAAYEVHQREKPLVDPFLGISVEWRLRQRFEPLLRKRLLRHYFRLYPRRRVSPNDDKLVKELGDTLVAEENDAILDTVERYMIGKAKIYTAARRAMERLAPVVELVPTKEINQLDDSWVGSYSSQTQSDKYAEKRLARPLSLLLQAGFDARVVPIGYNDEPHGIAKLFYSDVDGMIHYKPKKVARYVLFANAEAWMLDALQRRSTGTLYDWALQCWNEGVNPKVYNPWLDDDIFEKSMRESMKVGS